MFKNSAAAAAAKSRQSCLTLCDPIDGGPPGSHPWDSPGKHTGVGCHFLLQCMKVKSESEVTQRPHGLQPTRLLRPWDFPGKSTRVGCHCLLQGIFPTQGSNPGLLHCRQTLYCLSHQGGHQGNRPSYWILICLCQHLIFTESKQSSLSIPYG